MREEGHLQAAQSLEQGITLLRVAAGQERMLIEGAWGAGFHYLAYGCQRRHGQHQESHARLASALNALGEHDAATWWGQIDRLRQGGWYGNPPDVTDADAALAVLREIRQWAMI